MRYKAPTIAEMGGLKKHLNKYKSKHNGRGYSEFVEILNLNISVASQAALFGVDRRTIDKWTAIYNAENKK